jgi:hypothetical protein
MMSATTAKGELASEDHSRKDQRVDGLLNLLNPPIYPSTMAIAKVKISLSLSSDVLKGIDRLAVGAKVSRSAFIEAVLARYLRNQSAVRVQSPDPR